MTTAAELTTTNRSDYTWPYLAERQRIYDWDRHEYKKREIDDCRLSLFRDVAGSPTKEYSRNPPYVRLDFRPKSILGRQRSDFRYPTEKVIEYDKNIADAKCTVRQTRPRVYKCPQISLDELPADVRDVVCNSTYCTSKTMSELTSGVTECRHIPVDIPLKSLGDPGKFRPQSLYKTINPAKNWRRVSIEWDELQRRIFGGRSVD